MSRSSHVRCRFDLAMSVGLPVWMNAEIFRLSVCLSSTQTSLSFKAIGLIYVSMQTSLSGTIGKLVEKQYETNHSFGFFNI